MSATRVSPTAPPQRTVPEGDTLRVIAGSLGPALVGEVVVSLGGSHRAVAGEGRRIRGCTVTAVDAVGKHLVIEFDNGWALRTHLGMTGRWHRYAPGERWRGSPGRARVVLETASTVAVGFSIPTVELGPQQRIRDSIEHLGPDLSAESGDERAVLERVRRSHARTVADLLLDQSVAAGIGNVYKSEVAFLEGVHPADPPERLDDGSVTALYRRARRLLAANSSTHVRTTTGDRRVDQRLWVYGRDGEGCRRCGETIVVAELGKHARLTYWCPRCQPATTMET